MPTNCLLRFRLSARVGMRMRGGMTNLHRRKARPKASTKDADVVTAWLAHKSTPHRFPAQIADPPRITLVVSALQLKRAIRRRNFKRCTTRAVGPALFVFHLGLDWIFQWQPFGFQSFETDFASSFPNLLFSRNAIKHLLKGA